MQDFKIAAMICVLNEEEYIEYCIRHVVEAVDDVVVALTGCPWHWPADKPFPQDKTEEIVMSLAKEYPNIHIIHQNSVSATSARVRQNQHRQKVIDYIKQLYQGTPHRYCFWVDADEFYTQQGLSNLLSIVSTHLDYGSFSVPMRFYWRSFHYKIDLEQGNWDIIRVYRLYDRTQFREQEYNRINTIEPCKALTAQDVICHHFTTCRTEESMLFKIRTRAYTQGREFKMMHWYRNKFLPWPDRRNMKNLHPTKPQIYHRAIRLESDTDFPDILKQHPYYQQEVIV